MSYGYYKTSYSSSRGRGYNTRGSYRSRGTGGGESSYYGRGSYRGRSSWQTDPSSTSYNSRSHYNSGGATTSSSRPQTDDSGYHRYSRGDEGDYSSHDRSYDTSRKRMRTDQGYVQASSSHRSHEGAYDGTSDYNNRYYSGDKESYNYHNERHTSSGFRDRSRDEYVPHRKQEPLQVSMPSSSSRYMSSRGSYRSRPRGMGIRGYRGAISKISYIRRPTSVFARRRILVDPNSAIRKRILSSTTQADTLRRIRMAKLRRIRELTLKREALKRKLAREEKGTEDVSDDEEDDEEKEDDEDEGSKVAKKKAKLKKVVKKKSGDGEDGKEGDDDEEELDEEDAEEEEEDDDDTEQAGESGVVKKKKDSSKTEDGQAHTFHTRPFIKLSCPHCYTRCVTFQEYNTHLYSFKHMNAVRKLWRLHKAVLTQLRAKQRKRQRIIDSQREGDDDIPVKTKYCMACKLNYGEMKAEHVASEYHKKILDFMRPYCRICKYKLATPMMYEKHLCSLDHIKRKALLKPDKDVKGGKAKENVSEAEDEKDLDLDNFMTVDSIGTCDDAGEEDKKEEDDKPKEEKKPKAEVNPGSEHIKKVKVKYCELCRMYLTRSDKSDKSVSVHCQSRTHLAFYMRFHRRAERLEAEERRKKLLAKKAAKINSDAAKKEEDEDENEKMDVDNAKVVENDVDKEKSSVSKDKTTDGVGDAPELDDEKMWADVDKDLGDILREVEPDNKSSDEDDEGGRYDRFKYSKKGKDTEKTTEVGEDKSIEVDNKDEADAEEKPEAKSTTPSPVKKSPTATPK